MDPFLSTLIPLLVALFLSAFFSGMEIAYVSLDRLRLKVEQSSGLIARIMDLFTRKPNELISTILVGNNVALIVYGIMMARVIEGLFVSLSHQQLLLLVVETIISTLVILFFGEFIPKMIFKLYPHQTFSFFSIPLFLFYVILYPISKVTTGISFVILRLFGLKITTQDTVQVFGKIDLGHFVATGIDGSTGEETVDTEVKIFQNALDFSEIRLRDCIVPRTEIVAVDRTASIAELQSLFIESGKSKLIVYDGSIDNIIGYIHAAEMFRNLTDWTESITKMPIVPDTMAAHKLMKAFIAKKRTLAVVVDEFGGTAGIVSLEDLVEEIFGEIEDEHDSNKRICKQLNSGEYLLSGRLEIDYANEQLGIDLPVSDVYLTIAGLILSEYQSFPKLNQIIQIKQYEFQILKVASTKIELVRMKIVD